MFSSRDCSQYVYDWCQSGSVSIFGFGSRPQSCSTCISVHRATCVQTSEEEDVGEARSGQERGACIVADPLLGLSQKRSRPGHIGTAYQQTDPDVEESGQRRTSSMILYLLLTFQITKTKLCSPRDILMFYSFHIVRYHKIIINRLSCK